ncbi:MAG: YbjN domain-containing protein [Sphingobium sp.]|nr:YbjN domain-containing protein [Sphingobium sp.]
MLSAAMLASGVQAADTEPCAKDMVCASAPETVVKALQDAGYKALLSKSETTGNPMIESSANGYNYNIFFYECEERKSCASLLFGISFTAEDSNTPQLANEWNKKMRFMQMAVDDDKVLHVNYDITTKGGLNQKNFADVVDWWSSMLAELRKFFDAHPSKK